MDYVTSACSSSLVILQYEASQDHFVNCMEAFLSVKKSVDCKNDDEL